MADRARLAIVGASARAAAYSALRAGFEVVAADLFADEDLRSRCPATRIESYPEGLADWLAEQDVDAWMYTGALENYPDLVDRMAAIKPLWGNRGHALRRVRDPFELQRVCRENDFRFPETRKKFDGLPLDGSWLRKTYRGSNGSGVCALRSEASPQVGAVFQERVNGVPAAAVFAASDSQCHLLGLSEQLVGEAALSAPAWAYCGSLARADWATAFHARLESFGVAVAAEFELKGLFGVDLLIDGDRLWVLEINPRYTASMEMFDSPLAAHAACFNHRTEPPASSFAMTGKAVLFAKQDVTVTERFSHWALDKAYANQLADIPAAGEQIEAGQPVLTLFDHGEADGVRTRLLESAGGVESRLYP